MIFILHYQYTRATVTPYNAKFVAAIRAKFCSGAADYRADKRVWLFDEKDEAKVLALVAEHFPQYLVKHFIAQDELVEV